MRSRNIPLYHVCNRFDPSSHIAALGAALMRVWTLAMLLRQRRQCDSAHSIDKTWMPIHHAIYDKTPDCVTSPSDYRPPQICILFEVAARTVRQEVMLKAPRRSNTRLMQQHRPARLPEDGVDRLRASSDLTSFVSISSSSSHRSHFHQPHRKIIH